MAETRTLARHTTLAAGQSKLASIPAAPNPNFGVLVLKSVPDVPNELLSRRNT